MQITNAWQCSATPPYMLQVDTERHSLCVLAEQHRMGAASLQTLGALLQPQLVLLLPLWLGGGLWQLAS
jgi:hypothetical protein